MSLSCQQLHFQIDIISDHKWCISYFQPHNLSVLTKPPTWHGAVCSPLPAKYFNLCSLNAWLARVYLKEYSDIWMVASIIAINQLHVESKVIIFINCCWRELWGFLRNALPRCLSPAEPPNAGVGASPLPRQACSHFWPAACQAL